MRARTVAALLAEAQAARVDRLDAQLLIAHRLGQPRSWVIANGDAPVGAQPWQQLHADIARRAAGVPLAHLTGTKEFHGLPLRITPDVMVPRPDTETLADWALELARTMSEPTVIDLGTGSGAIALAVKADCRKARVTATDASEAALAVARANAESLGLELRFSAGDWWAAVSGERFDLALCNPPYVAAGDPHLAALVHEPAQALVAGDDGLVAIRILVAGASAHLQPAGWLLLEHGHDQQAAVAALLGEQGFTRIETRRDLAGLPRCTGGRRAEAVSVAAPRQTFIYGSRPTPPDTTTPVDRRSIEARSGEPVMRTAIRCSVFIVAAASGLTPLATSAQPGEGLSLRPESVPWARFQGRLSLATSSAGVLHNDAASAAEPTSLRGLSVMGDYYLTGSLLGARQSGGLRATSALLVGPRWQSLGAGSLGLPSTHGGRGLMVERRLPALTPDADPNAALPYLGIGYTGLSSRGGFSFSADLGVVALAPGSSGVRFGRAATPATSASLDDAVRDLRLTPMLQLGVSYSF